MNEKIVSTQILRREPIITNENPFPVDSATRQWMLITEAIKREMVVKPEVRQALIEFCTKPVSEMLPLELSEKLQTVNVRAVKLFQRYCAPEGVTHYLNLPSVPENAVGRDLRQAMEFQTPEEISAQFAHTWGKDSATYNQFMHQHIDGGTFMKGITSAEKSLIATRSSFARDVKILALGAEILEQSISLTPNAQGEIFLPSGIKIVLDISQDQARLDLLSPHLWKKRQQLKDRVYKIETQNSSYILKERKTNRHLDTRITGHADGLTSAEEFATGQVLQEKGEQIEGDIKVSWEKPVGFVEFPDGFQFTVFEFLEETVPEFEIIFKTAEAIKEHPAQFEAEYQTIAALAPKYLSEPSVSDNELSFEEFAMVKAFCMRKKAPILMQEMLMTAGYINEDSNDYSYRITTNNNNVQLEIIGFDFEYFVKISENERQQRVFDYVKSQQIRASRERLNFATWGDNIPVTKNQRAAYLAMRDARWQKESTS